VLAEARLRLHGTLMHSAWHQLVAQHGVQADGSRIQAHRNRASREIVQTV
jgi:hypothetical protein